MRYKLQWWYDGSHCESPDYPCESFGEIMEQVKHVMKNQDNPPMWVIIYVENGTVIRLPV